MARQGLLPTSKSAEKAEVLLWSWLGEHLGELLGEGALSHIAAGAGAGLKILRDKLLQRHIRSLQDLMRQALLEPIAPAGPTPQNLRRITALMAPQVSAGMGAGWRSLTVQPGSHASP